ncbi:uncharacterized protein LOC126653663 isoform X2 [Mercurialis annua]|nr:uncharacterized protein LOC126653663 isoform X2 [Mercurialis annua]
MVSTRSASKNSPPQKMKKSTSSPSSSKRKIEFNTIPATMKNRRKAVREDDDSDFEDFDIPPKKMDMPVSYAGLPKKEDVAGDVSSSEATQSMLSKKSDDGDHDAVETPKDVFESGTPKEDLCLPLQLL